MQTDCLAVERHESAGGVIAEIRLAGAKNLNLVDAEILLRATDEFSEQLLTLDGLRCIWLRGRDARAFIGGANLHALRALDRASAEPFIRALHGFCAALRTAPVPVIALLQGYCLGAGLEIAAACDLRIGDQTVQCGMPEVRVGVPSVVEAALLPGLIGWGAARELMLRGNIVNAESSRAMGLLQHLVPDDELETLARRITADIVASAPGAVAAQKALFLEWEDHGISTAIECGVQAFSRAYDTDEPQRAIDNFFARRGQGTA